MGDGVPIRSGDTSNMLELGQLYCVESLDVIVGFEKRLAAGS